MLEGPRALLTWQYGGSILLMCTIAFVAQGVFGPKPASAYHTRRIATLDHRHFGILRFPDRSLELSGMVFVAEYSEKQ